MAQKTALDKVKEGKIQRFCVCCGENKIEDNFYTSKWSKIWNKTNNKVLVCKECIQKLFIQFKFEYDEYSALKICCHYLDVPLSKNLYESILQKNKNQFSFGMYLRQLTLWQNRAEGFEKALVNGELTKTVVEQREEREANWSRSDKQNMNYCLSVCGYDPFDCCGLTDLDRKYCFNILAGYCDSQGISEDGHKIQSVIQISQSQLQCRKIDEFINDELSSANPNEAKLKSLASTKKQLLDSIAKIAQDNNISSAYNQNSKRGAHTLSAKMKEMADNGFESIYVNAFDIKTCEAMQQIAQISNKAILDELTLDANDYTEIVKEQREMLIEADNKNAKLAEENRMLKNKLIDLQAKKKK